MIRELCLPHENRFRNCATISRSRTRTSVSGSSYKRDVNDHPVAEEWGEYLLQELGAGAPKRSRLRTRWPSWKSFSPSFHDGNRVLPGLSFERIWFLHSLRGPERMLQTRAVLGLLTAELAACTSA